MKQFISEGFFDFFKKLAANNHKDWFDENKKWYETDVKKPFEQLVDALLEGMTKSDKSFGGVQAKDCIFRINRDIRFSKDKTPYKLNRSAVITPGGKKNIHARGFYFELGPEECAIYSGIYMPEKETLNAVRNYIAGHLKQFDAILENKEFKKNYGKVLGDKQKRLDPSLKEAAEKQPLIFNTQFYIMHEIPLKKVLSKDIVEYILEKEQICAPFNDFMAKAIQVKQAK